jgi:hypothetical protein
MEPRAPLTLSAGIVEFIAERPSDPRFRIEGRLIAARTSAGSVAALDPATTR